MRSVTGTNPLTDIVFAEARRYVDRHERGGAGSARACPLRLCSSSWRAAAGSRCRWLAALRGGLRGSVAHSAEERAYHRARRDGWLTERGGFVVPRPGHLSVMKIQLVVRSAGGAGEPDVALYDMPAVPREGDTVELDRFGTVTVTSVSWTPEFDDSQDAVVVTEV